MAGTPDPIVVTPYLEFRTKDTKPYKRRQVVLTIPSETYPSGGYPLTAAMLGFTKVVSFTVLDMCNGDDQVGPLRRFIYDTYNSTLRACEAKDDDSDIELSNGDTDAEGSVLYADILGY
jgi:hypothetical protein